VRDIDELSLCGYSSCHQMQIADVRFERSRIANVAKPVIAE